MSTASSRQQDKERICSRCKLGFPASMFVKGSPYCQDCRKRNRRRYQAKATPKAEDVGIVAKVCRECRRELPSRDFSGKSRACKQCLNEYRRQRYRKRKTTLVIATESQCIKCKEIKPASEFFRNYGTRTGLAYKCKACDARYFRQRLYRTTHENIDSLLAASRCEICQTPFIKESEKLIDHDHESGLIRGVLCTYCNSIIGYCREDTRTLYNAIQYLNTRKTTAGSPSDCVVSLDSSVTHHKGIH